MDNASHQIERKQAVAQSTIRRLGFLLLALATTAIAITLDGWVESLVEANLHKATEEIAEIISHTANGQWPLLASLAICGLGVTRKRSDWKRLGLLLVLTTSLAGLSAKFISLFPCRARPSNKVEQGWFGPYHDGHWLAGRHPYSSFPSGHTASAAAVAAVLLVTRNRARWFFLFWAVAVAWSRIALRAHFFSDTVASGFIAWWWAVQLKSWLATNRGLASRFRRWIEA